jgi:predicted amidohydrolase
MQDIRVAAVTATPVYENVAGNLRKILDYSTNAAGRGANLVLFPEAFLSGYDLTAIERTARTLDSEEVRTITGLAEKKNLVIGFGLLERSAEGFHVTQMYVGRDIRAHHRKAHLTNWDEKFCKPGESLDIQDIGLAKLGTLICYDSAFPAAAETLVRKGAEILIQPSCHGTWAKDVAPADRTKEIARRKRHIEKYWASRAYDFTCYVIYLNHAGETTRGEWFPNYVGFFGPDGETITDTTAEGEQMIVADLSAAFLTRSREQKIGHYHSLGDARPELYWK